MITNNGLVPDFVLESFKFCDVYGSFFRKKLGYFQLSPQPHTRARGSQKANAWVTWQCILRRISSSEGGRKYITGLCRGQHAPAGRRPRGVGSRWPPRPPPAGPSRQRPLSKAGAPVVAGSQGSRALALLQDGTGYDSPVCAPASLIFPSFQKQIERSLIWMLIS